MHFDPGNLRSLPCSRLTWAARQLGVPGEVFVGFGVEITPPRCCLSGARPVAKPGDADYGHVRDMMRHRHQELYIAIARPMILTLSQ
jgi:hypothetical protein